MEFDLNKLSETIKNNKIQQVNPAIMGSPHSADL
jgi:hypothetical protein